MNIFSSANIASASENPKARREISPPRLRADKPYLKNLQNPVRQNTPAKIDEEK
ncbi:MAG: hypothetical protein ACR2HG_15730 [Pyrinomonadaceae bacterium]